MRNYFSMYHIGEHEQRENMNRERTEVKLVISHFLIAGNLLRSYFFISKRKADLNDLLKNTLIFCPCIFSNHLINQEKKNI